MLIDDSDLKLRVEVYAKRKRRTIEDLDKPLGWGSDGRVWETHQTTAVKIVRRQEVYETELECYRRFVRNNVFAIRGFNIPRLIDCDHELFAIEMDVIEPPRILDFGKVALDRPPDFSQQTMEYWVEEHREIWGKLWPTIQKVLAELRQLGIFYSDPSPRNITPENWDPEI